VWKSPGGYAWTRSHEPISRPPGSHVAVMREPEEATTTRPLRRGLGTVAPAPRPDARGLWISSSSQVNGGERSPSTGSWCGNGGAAIPEVARRGRHPLAFRTHCAARRLGASPCPCRFSPAGAGPRRPWPPRRQSREAHLPAQQPTARQAPRLPPSHVRPRRPGRRARASPQGPQAPLGLTRILRRCPPWRSP